MNPLIAMIQTSWCGCCIIYIIEDDELLLLYRAGVDEQLISNFNILQGNQRNAPHPIDVK
jgi:hypothetical protein